MSCTSSTGRRPFASDLEYSSTSCSCSAVGAPGLDSLCLACSSAVGVVTDVAHHAAAAAWIAGLAIIGWIVIPKTTHDVLVPAVRCFSRVAAISVALLVVTGLVQTVRLIGSPMDLLDANRRRIDQRLVDADDARRHTGALRQAVVAEFAIGLVIVAITAAMVVSPPSSSKTETGARRRRVDLYTT